ncbi:MAG TPA: hypothetical protein VFZ75_02500 [Actinomycetota bacterium]|nr:hypothetical protein [Actinomycetota bacterium]
MGWVAAGLLLLGLGILGWTVIENWSAGVTLGYLVVGMVLLSLIVWVPTTTWGARLLDTRGFTAFRWVRNVVLGLLPWVWFNAYLTLLEPWFQRGGSMERLRSKGPPGR